MDTYEKDDAMRNVFFFCATLVLSAVPLSAQLLDLSPASPVEEHLTIRAIPRYTHVAPGETFYVALEVHIADGWVYYGPAPGEEARKVGVPPARVETQADRLTTGETLWLADVLKPAAYGFPAVWSYKKHTILYVPITVPAEASPGETTITLKPFGQICGPAGCFDIQGMLGDANFAAKTTVMIGNESKRNPAWNDDKTIAEGLESAKTAEQLRASHIEKEAERQAGLDAMGNTSSMGFWTAVGVALLAGLTLNIMPCVLPVIPIRILSIVEMAGHSRRRFVTMGLAFAAGMMLFFVGVAAINVVLKLTVSAGFDINQGFQHPAVIIALAVIVVALAANLFGLFNVIVPGKVANLETNVQSQAAGYGKSVFMGVMTAVLATPCSFAFLAAALAYAQTAPLVRGTLVILAVGIGMSFPHAVLAAFPSLVDRLPRPGAWMERFRQTTGFILLLVAIWLLSTLRDGGGSYPYWVLAWNVVLVFCLWMWTTWVRYDATRKRKCLVRGIAVVIALGGGVWMLRQPAKPLVEPIPFSLSDIEQARAEGRVVLVKFTATWCAKCIQLEYQVYNTPRVADAIRDMNVVYMKGDVSRADMPAAVWMRENGYGVGIPLSIIFPPTGDALPPMRSDMTVETLVDALNQAAGKKP